MLINDFDELAKQLNNVISKELAVKESKLIRFEPKLQSIITHRLNDSKTYLGRTTLDEVKMLFNETCQSIALYLIGDVDAPLGILAFSSDDPLQFTPSHDNTFINEFVQALKIKLIDIS